MQERQLLWAGPPTTSMERPQKGLHFIIRDDLADYFDGSEHSQETRGARGVAIGDSAYRLQGVYLRKRATGACVCGCPRAVGLPPAPHKIAILGSTHPGKIESGLSRTLLRSGLYFFARGFG
jgi:hypothetical protein